MYKPYYDRSSYVLRKTSWRTRGRVYATILRLSSHKLAIETDRCSRISREDRLYPSGIQQTEEHVIRQCPLSEHILSQFVTVPFTNIADFLIVLK